MRDVDNTKKGIRDAGLQKIVPGLGNPERAQLNAGWPFAEVFKTYAQGILAGGGVSPIVRNAFADHLSERLAEILSPILYLDFFSRRAAANLIDGHSTGVYSSFIKDLRLRTLNDALAAYPLAQQALVRVSEQVGSFAREFDQQMANDGPLLTCQWPWANRNSLVRIAPGRSDPHRNARTVIRLDFDNGKQLYYKPRSLEVDKIWSRFANRCTDMGTKALRAPSTLDCGTHGWAEGVRAHPEFSRIAGEIYSYRFGILTCLAWLLDATDLHPENIVATRTGPVPVDLECFGHPRIEGEPYDVNRTGLREGSPAESFIGTDLTWEGLGSDTLRMTMVSIGLPRWSDSLPQISRDRRSSFIAEGFEHAAVFACANRSLVEDYREEIWMAPRRQIVRPTVFYYHLLNAAKGPQCMRSANEWQKVTSQLLAVGDATKVNDECRQLADWDIPVFAAVREKPGPLPWELLATPLLGR